MSDTLHFEPVASSETAAPAMPPAGVSLKARIFRITGQVLVTIFGLGLGAILGFVIALFSGLIEFAC